MGAGGAGGWGLYVHIPFCPYRCDYCDFVAVAAGPRVARWHEPYAAALVAEARFWAGRLRMPGPPATVFYGGGTPTALGAGRLAALHRALEGVWGRAPDAEVTVECNPGTIDAAGLAALRGAGVTRLSLGLQAAQDRLLRAVHRGHGQAEFLEAWGAARACGFDNLAVDLMVGLPGQGAADVAETLELLGPLRPEHVSVYALQVEEGTVLGARAARGAVALPDDDAALEQWSAAGSALEARGYEHYEISNFALPGRRCRHNLGYWRNGDWLGLGVGAHSHWAGARWRNTISLAVHRDGLRAPGAAAAWTCGQEEPDPERRRSEDAFLGLRLLREGVDLRAYAERHGISLGAAFPGAVEQVVAQGLCTVEAGRLRLRPEAVPLANRACAAFV